MASRLARRFKVIFLTLAALAKHAWIVGASGAGKSWAFEGWASELIVKGVGVGIIDPAGDLFSNLLTRIALLSKQAWSKVVVFDPRSHHAVGFNPLELLPGEEAVERAGRLASIITKLFKQDPFITARMQRLMLHTFWLLIVSNLTLVELPRLLTNFDFRERLLSRLTEKDIDLLTYWNDEFPQKNNPRLVTEWTQPVLNKIGALVADPHLKRIFGQRRSTIDFREIMDSGKVLLVNLSKGKLGADKSHLLGGFILAQIQLAALSRDELPASKRRQWVLFIDEFQNVLTEDIEVILAESRKYSLSLVLANQFFGQLRDQPKLQDAILNTVHNWVIFRSGAQDAELYSKDVFNPPVDVVKEIRIRGGEMENVWRPLAEITELTARQIKNLKDREFFYKRKGYGEAKKLRTVTLPELRLTPRLVVLRDELIVRSLSTYALPIAEVDAEIAARRRELYGNDGDAPMSDNVG